uniref:Uncharacterized protein n=1 Tax=Medicago truncatula TaxID=3880 RepID=A2Q2S2_MEDTR|nr:hypothetical protein MtrDRAFT_AC151598g47v2 [Medicago truncatula]
MLNERGIRNEEWESARDIEKKKGRARDREKKKGRVWWFLKEKKIGVCVLLMKMLNERGIRDEDIKKKENGNHCPWGIG